VIVPGPAVSGSSSRASRSCDLELTEETVKGATSTAAEVLERGRSAFIEEVEAAPAGQTTGAARSRED